MKHGFSRDPEGGSIIAFANLDNARKLTVMVDTGASVSNIDVTFLKMAGYDLSHPIGKALVQTAASKIEVDVYKFRTLSAFGITRHNIEVQVYDYYAYGIMSVNDGVLGLDFFEGTRFAIDLVEENIEVSVPSKRSTKVKM